MKNSPDNNFRYKIENPEEFKRVYKLCEDIIKTYPLRMKRTKIIIGFNAGVFVLNYCASIWHVYSHQLIYAGIHALLAVFQLWFTSKWYKTYQTQVNLLKISKEKKEHFDFVLSFNSSPDDIYKKSQDPFQ